MSNERFGDAPSLSLAMRQLSGKRVHLLATEERPTRMLAALLDAIGADCSLCPLGEGDVGPPCPAMSDPALDLIVGGEQPGGQHPDLAAARERDIPIIDVASTLGMLLADQCVCAVAGPTAEVAARWLVRVLRQNGDDPSYLYTVPERDGMIHIGASQIWVVAVDVTRRDFHALHPRMALITGFPPIAPSPTEDAADVHRLFDAFVAGMDLYTAWPYDPLLILNADDIGCRLLAARMAAWPGQILRYAVNDPTADLRAKQGVGGLSVRERGAARSVTLPLADGADLAAILGALSLARRIGVGPTTLNAAFTDAHVPDTSQ